jgi:hypothetical protein
MAQRATDETTEWTVMAYMAGDNNLNEEMVLTLQEMLASAERYKDRFAEQAQKKTGKKREEHLWPRVKILAQLDPSGLGLPTQRYVFDTTSTNPKLDPSNEHRLETYEVPPPNQYVSENTGNPNALSGFVRWSVEDKPHEAVAKRYMLILSGHGSGTTEDFLLKDSAPADSLTIPELETALVDAKGYLFGKDAAKEKIDVLGMDCCFMSMVEVYYQIREHVEFAVGAESMIPDFGWPYDRILAKAEELRWKVLEQPVEPRQLAETIVREFIEFYSDYDRTAGRSVDIAAIELEGLNGLAKSIADLAGALCDVIEDSICAEQIHLAHLEAQTYKFDQFIDIRDFCLLLRDRFRVLKLPKANAQQKVASVVKASSRVLRAQKACVLLSGCSGFAYQHSYGLSIYFPWAIDKTPEAYKALAFNSDVKSQGRKTWADFVDEYLRVTRRRMRTGMKNSTKMDREQRTAIDSAISGLVESLTSDRTLPVVRIARAHLGRLAHLRGVGDSGDLHAGSRYHKSRYHKSRYHKSRWPGDREKSVKNFTPVVGKVLWPVKKER